MANQVTERKPGSESETGGTSGTAEVRSVPPTPIIRTLSARCCGTEVATVSKNRSTWPAIRLLSAGTAPR